MIKAVIFDFFSVLVTKDYGSYTEAFYPNDPSKRTQTTQLYDQLGLGRISYDEMIDSLAKIGNTDRETALKYTENYRANQPLLEYIRTKLYGKYQLGIISNAGSDWVEKLLGDDKQLFDNIVLSYQAGFIKPDTEIYEISLKNLAVKAEESVFIDDILTYCQGAEAVGMNTIWYKDFEQMKTELEKILTS